MRPGESERSVLSPPLSAGRENRANSSRISYRSRKKQGLCTNPAPNFFSYGDIFEKIL
jgi:hypothetical protein